MMVPQLPLGVVEQVAGGLGGATVLLFAGRWMRRLNVIGRILSLGGLFLIFIGALALTPAVDVHPGALVRMAESAHRLASGALAV